MRTAAMLITLTLTAGCANVQGVRLTDDGNEAALTATNQGRLHLEAGPDGTLTSPRIDLTSQTSPPTLVWVDQDGIVSGTTAVGGIVALGDIGQIWSPGDVEIADITVTTDANGTPTLKATGIKVNTSNQAAIWAAQISVVVAATESMSRIEADRYVASLEAAGKITAEVAQVVRDIYIPRLPGQ